MFIRQVKKQRSKTSKVFYQYTLAQTSRINGKVKQHTILYLGSEKIMEDKENRQIVLRILKSKIFDQAELFPTNAPEPLKKLALDYYQKYLVKYEQSETNPTSIPPAADKADFQSIDIKGVAVEDVKEYGAENLCKQTLDKLQLASFFKEIGFTKSQTTKSLISIASRAIYASSEHKTAKILELNSSLKACYQYDKKITHKQLYSISDLLYKNKSQIDKYLYNQLTDMFNIKDSLVIFDISNTYFETRKANSKIAKYGRSKEKRYDCPLVVFTGVINKEGFIRHSRIYEGNKADSTTLSDMIADLKAHSPNDVQQTIVIDAGIATDKNLALINQEGYKYVCVSNRRLKEYQLDRNNDKVVLENQRKEKIELEIFHPKGYTDTWMYIESEGKRKKEESINLKLKQRFEEALASIKASFYKKGGTKQINKVWERIGRVKEKYKAVSARYEIVVSQKDQKATDMQWTFIKNKLKDEKAKGVYFIRTNYKDISETKLWDIYNTIREVEATFRSLKTDLNIRPVHHQKDSRIKAHLYLTMLAYQLVNTIRHMLKDNNIKQDWKNIVRIMSTQKLQTLKLPTDKKVIHIRKPSQPINEVKKIYNATNCSYTQKVIKKYVVYH